MGKSEENVRATRAKWQAINEEYERSGLRVEEFCKEQSISHHSLKKWRVRIRAEQRTGKVCLNDEGTRRSIFREVNTKRSNSARADSNASIRYTLILHNGRELRIEGNNTELELSKIIEVLERC